MRKYEMVVIVDSDVDERTVASSMEKLLTVVRTDGGTVEDIDVWGKRKFAYEINKKTEGTYVVVTFTAESKTTQELDRQLGLNESIVRTKLMRLDD